MAIKNIVRFANMYDLYGLEFMLNKGIEESGGLLPKYNQTHVYKCAIDLINQDLVFVAAAYDDDKKIDKLLGGLMLDLQSFAWNPAAKLLQSVHFYVMPDARGQKTHDGVPLWQALIKAAQTLAETVQIPLRIDSFFKLDEGKAEARDQLFKSAGMAYAGGSFMYVPQPDESKQAAE